MFSLSRALVAGALLAASASAGDHFILTQVRSLEYSRVDPMVTAGKNGPHVHHVLGGSAFGPNTGTPDSLEQSQCTSSLVGDDKSAYWTPLLYYKNANGTYSPMTGQTRIYYFMKPGNGTIPVKAFPRGHRMLAGPPSDQRPAEYPPKGSLSYDQLQAMDPRVAAIKWGCSAGAVQGQGDGGSIDGQSPWLPNHAPNGCGVVNAGIFYPSCSDGRLDSDDHFSHMMYPLDGTNGFNCPPSHPIKYPTMFLEHFYFPTSDQPYRGPNQDNWVLSNGDTTGLTMHADFINAWTPGVLEDTMAQCNTPNAPEDNLSACAPLAKTLSVDNANKCRSQGDIVDEEVGLTGPLSALPGCNPIWPLDARTKPSCKSSELPMGQPDGRVEFPALALALPVVNGSNAKTVVASSTTAPITTSTTAGASTTSSVASTTSTTSSAASTTSSGSSASTSATSDPYAYGAASSGTSTSATESSSSTSAAGSSSSTSATASSTGYADPYNYGAPAGSSSSSASAAAVTSNASGSASTTSSISATPSSTASSDPYAYGAPAGSSSSSTSAGASVAEVGAGSSSTSSTPAAATTSTASSDPYVYGAPAAGSTSSTTAASASTSAASSSDPYAYGAPAPAAGSSSSSSPTRSAAAAAATTSATSSSAPYQYGAPAPAVGSSSSVSPTRSVAAAAVTTSASHVAAGSAPGVHSVTYVAPGTTSAPHAASSPGSKSVQMNPPASSSSSSAGVAPTPQKANAAPKPKKTCAHRKHKNHGTGHNRRQMRKRMIK